MQFLDLTVQGWLEQLGERGPAPGGGSAAAITAAMAAQLVGMAARLSSDSWSEAGGVSAQASALGARLAELAQAAARLVEVNLSATRDDPRVEQARAAAETAARAMRRVFLPA